MKKWIMIFGLLACMVTPVQAAIAPLGEVASVNAKPEKMFKKWRSMLARQGTQNNSVKSCKRTDGEVCIPRKMLKQVRFTNGESASEKLEIVNKAVTCPV